MVHAGCTLLRWTHILLCVCFCADVPDVSVGGPGLPGSLLQAAERALHAFVGQRVGPFIAGVAGMALDPAPIDFVAA
jgi:hypothetical protein